MAHQIQLSITSGVIASRLVAPEGGIRLAVLEGSQGNSCGVAVLPLAGCPNGMFIERTALRDPAAWPEESFLGSMRWTIRHLRGEVDVERETGHGAKRR